MEKVTLKYIGSGTGWRGSDFDGTELSVRPGGTVTMSYARAKKVMADYPASFEQVINLAPGIYGPQDMAATTVAPESVAPVLTQEMAETLKAESPVLTSEMAETLKAEPAAPKPRRTRRSRRAQP